jgi:hypothetical protein
MKRDWLILLALGGFLQASAITLAGKLDLGNGFIVFLGSYLSMFMVYALAVYFVLQHVRGTNGQLTLVLLFAVAFRIPFLFAAPVLSDDVFRYIWDGRVQRDGINPYRYPPKAPEIEHLRDSIYDGINNKDIPTIYPPAMQIVFAATTFFSESVVWMKGLFVAFDLVLIGVLVGLLKAMGMSPLRVLIYAWSPLVVMEIAGSGHNDVLGLAFLLAAHAAIIRKKDVLSICSLSMSGLSKLMGFILVPLFARSLRPRSWVALPLTTLLVSWPYLDAGLEAFRGLWEFGTRWRANDSLFHLLYLLTGSLTTAKAIAAAAFAGLMGYLLIRRVNPLRGCYLAIGAILLLSTTVHPWYLVWMVPYLCIYPNPAWLLLTGTVVLSYHAPFLATAGGPWIEHTSFKLLEYSPFFGLLALLAFPPFQQLLGKRPSVLYK